MSRLFRVNTVNSDGSAPSDERLIEFYVVDPATNKPFVGDDGKPSVVVTLRPISQAKYRSVQANHTERVLNKKTRAMEDLTDFDAVQDELIGWTVQGWRGILGADDKPLQCVLDAKLALPGELKNELIARAMQGEGIDAAASFRATA